MWRFKLIIFPAVIFCLNSIAQNNWQKIISNGDAIYTRDVLQLLDSNYLVIGSSSGYGDYSANAYIMKLNQSGNHLWTRWFGGAQTEWFFEGVQNADSTMVFVGYTNSFTYGGYDIYVVKTDKTGNLIWQKNFGGQDWDFAYSISKTFDGGYLICGETYSFGNGNNDGFLLKINDNGDSLWMNMYGGTQNDVAYKVIELSDQSIAFTGSTNSHGFGQEDIWYVRATQTGVVIKDTTYGTAAKEEGKSLIETQTNYIIITGKKFNALNNSTDMGLTKINYSGNIYWDDFLGGNNEDQSFDVFYHPAYDEYFYVGETNSFGQGANDFIIYGFTEYLGFIYGNTFGTIQNESCYSGKATYDKGIIAAGETDFGNGIRSIYLVKLDSTFVNPPPPQNTQDITSVVNNLRNKQTIIYPIPANDMFYVKCYDKIISRIEITDINGQIILNHTGHNSVSCTSWPNGIYLLKIIFGDNSCQLEKIMIQH
jgi:hypothetical protein